MLFVLPFLVIVAVCVFSGIVGYFGDVLYYRKDKHNWFTEKCYYSEDGVAAFTVIVCTVMGIVIFIMMCIMPIMYCGLNGTVDQLYERERALTYKVESGACRDELGLLSKEVIDEVQAWNESLIRNKRLQDDIWLGIFVPDIYDQYELIDYESYKR